MLPEKLRGGRLALDLCRGAVPNLLRCSAAVYVDQVGVGPGSQQGVHAPQHLDQSVGVPVRACSARAHLPFTQADGTSMVEGGASSAVCLTYRDPRGAKRVTTCTAGGFTAARRPTYMLSLQAKLHTSIGTTQNSTV